METKTKEALINFTMFIGLVCILAALFVAIPLLSFLAFSILTLSGFLLIILSLLMEIKMKIISSEKSILNSTSFVVFCMQPILLFLLSFVKSTNVLMLIPVALICFLVLLAILTLILNAIGLPKKFVKKLREKNMSFLTRLRVL